MTGRAGFAVACAAGLALVAACGSHADAPQDAGPQADVITLPDAAQVPDAIPWGDGDDDGVPDTIEGRETERDTDADGVPDWRDYDSDNDGLGDGQEDVNGDGVVDPGESDRTVQDTDGDEYSDLLEWAGHGDPQDPASLPDLTYLFVTPLYAPEQEAGVRYTAGISAGDVDVSGIPVADPAELPQVDTSNFVTGIVPLPPAPPGCSIDGDVFRNVSAGTTVLFTMHVRNTSVDQTPEARIYHVEIRVMGDGVTVLDTHDVWIVVPALPGG